MDAGILAVLREREREWVGGDKCGHVEVLVAFPCAEGWNTSMPKAHSSALTRCWLSLTVGKG